MNGSAISGLLFLAILTMLLLCVRNGYGILCYNCHQTSPECNNGNLDAAHQKDCPIGSCITMKYETHMPSKPVLATIRDCAFWTHQELMKMVSSDVKLHTRLVTFKVCNTSLCNSSSNKVFSTNYIFTTLIALVHLIVT